jgi:sulfatase modifying factor 1
MKMFRWLLLTSLVVSQASNSAPPDATPVTASNDKSGLEMVLVKGGTFTMGGYDGPKTGGAQASAAAAECPHEVTLGDFWIGKYEVTQADWISVMGNNPSYFQEDPQCPVEQVSWDDLQEFVRRLNATGGMKYRLPTEEEWEFAARGGLLKKECRFSGSNLPLEVAWARQNSGNKTHPVGALGPNELGICDMSGNVWEWCSSFQVSYPCDPAGKKLEVRVLRGGSYASSLDNVRVKDRNGRRASLRLSTLGFRLAK